ncbi:MAG: hypothetical protein JWP91_4733 [Fibrobacteres bacterium]|nr:hypothetical protein [Fibrobacterota bacterium]
MNFRIGKQVLTAGASVVWAVMAMGCIQDAPDPVPDPAPGSVAPRWQAARKPDGFTYTVTRLCFCREEYRGPFNVVASKDRVIRAVRVTDSGEVDIPEAELQALSVDSVLMDLSLKLESGFHLVSSFENPETGIPSRVELDQSEAVYDDEFGIAIDFFQPVKHRPRPL